MTCDSEVVIQQGKTWSRVLRWETSPIVYKAISAITQLVPVRMTVASHGLVANWRAAITGVGGMVELNARSDPPRSPDYHKATVVDANTIELNSVNASSFSAYTSGGYVQYNTPVNLTGYTARMQIRRNFASSTVLKELTVANGAIVIDNTAKTITATISATDTAGFTWTTAVFDLEMVSPGGVVTQLWSGSMRVVKEVTR